MFAAAAEYRYEHCSSTTRRPTARSRFSGRSRRGDRNVKVIVNTRNFGHVRSPYHALLQCRGDAVIGMAADLQDPPELIPAFLEKWREGYKVVLGVKAASEESAVMFAIRRLGYA